MTRVSPVRSPILVAVPPTGPVGHISGLAAALARHTGSELLLATVVAVPRVTPFAEAKPTLRRRSERLRVLGDGLSGIAPTRRMAVVAESPAQGLMELVRRHGPEILVVGWPRSSGLFSSLGRTGSPLDELVRRAPCHVCVAERAPPARPERVLVALSSPEGAQVAMEIGRAVMGPGSEREPRLVIRERHEVASLLEEASTGEADLLVTDALEPRGFWPFRWRALPLSLPGAFPGPVVLLRPAGASGTRARPAGTSARSA